MVQNKYLYRCSRIGNWFWVSLIIITILITTLLIIKTQIILGIIGPVYSLTLISFIILFILICITKSAYNIKRYIIIKNNVLLLPYNYRYVFPSRAVFRQLDLSNTRLIDTSIPIPEVTAFLSMNPRSMLSVMVNQYNYREDPSKYLVLKYYYKSNIYYLILIKSWFEDLDGFINSMKKYSYIDTYNIGF